jgi:hypothetical protein
MELPDAEAAEYCAAGMADPVTDFKESEKTVVPPAEERAERTAGLTKKTGPRGG